MEIVLDEGEALAWLQSRCAKVEHTGCEVELTWYVGDTRFTLKCATLVDAINDGVRKEIHQGKFEFAGRKHQLAG